MEKNNQNPNKKVRFLSFLGASQYTETYYYIGKDENGLSTKFCQIATINYLTKRNKDPVQLDKAVFFLTNTAKDKNWDGPNGLKQELDNFNESLIGLKKNHIQIMTVNVPDGNNKTEIWNIFDLIVSSVEDNDNIYLDITHAFRFLPMLLVIVLGYLRYTKNIEVKGIFYGAYEARNKDNNKTPIFDLSDLYTMYNWVFAVKSLVELGDASEFKDITLITPFFFEDILGISENIKKSQDFEKNIEAFTNLISNIRYLRGPKIQECVEIKNIKEFIGLKHGIKPLTPLFEKIRREFDSFNKNSVYNGIVAARWAYNHNLIQESVTLLEEFIIQSVIEAIFALKESHNHLIHDMIIENHEKKAKLKDLNEIETRNFVSSLISVGAKREKEENWRGNLTKSDELKNFAKLLKDSIDGSFFTNCLTLINTRNDLNHAGFGDTQLPENKLKNNLNKALEYFEHYNFTKLFKMTKVDNDGTHNKP